MGNRTPTLGEVIKQWVDSGKETTRVAQPGRVESYDAATMRAAVTPLLRAPVHGSDGAVMWVQLPRVENVPVLMPFAGGKRIKLPVTVGDVLLLVFTDFSLNEWKSGSGSADPLGVVQPGMLGAHQVADCIAIPGLLDPRGQDAADAIEVQSDGAVLVDGGGQHLVRGDAYRSAQGTLDAAFQTFLAALSTYAADIKAVADPTNAATPALLAASTALTAAITSFESGGVSYLSRNQTS